MADNVALNAGVGGVDAAADDIGGVFHQRVKLSLGADGSATDALGGSGVDAAGVQRVTLATNVALPAGTNAIGKLAANSGVDIGDVDVTSCALPTGASTAAKQDTEIALLASIDGKITAVNTGAVVVSSSALPTGAATAAKQPALGTAGSASTDVISVQGIASMTPLLTTATVAGAVAHDGADSGNPIKIGGRADTTFQAAAADGDRVDAHFDVYGVQSVRDDHPNKWSYHDDDAAAVTTDGAIQSAPGAGLSVYITDIIFSIGAATASSIFVEESTTKILGPYYLEAIAGRSIHIRFKTPKKVTANTSPLVTNTGSIAFSVDILGFIAP